ncbi:MAG: hypothetical protein ACD_25C00075G0003 [uncultured bacterium]|nr:hypothetical protein P147_WWE3C00001G0117 [candidate division WWE3 bacterium RAAC2_WWE3_1]EKD95088.1 MAG: hypothetical protein ACD_25C00075G0003 [uncultured bacterium]
MPSAVTAILRQLFTIGHFYSPFFLRYLNVNIPGVWYQTMGPFVYFSFMATTIMDLPNVGNTFAKKTLP